MRLENYAEALEKCSHCGFCQATCPVYLEDLLETHLTRSRINLIRSALIDKSLPVTRRVKEIINRCLLCTNCTHTCPGGLPCDEIIAAARAELGGKSGSAGAVKKFILRRVLNKRGLAGIMSRVGSTIQKLNIVKAEVPTLAAKPFDSIYSGTISPKGKIRSRVAYFVGCASNYIYPDTGEAVVKVLVHNGVEVIIPQGQVCCGLPAMAEGDLETARNSVSVNMKILAGMQVDAIVTDCTSCGMMLKVKAAKVLPGDDPLQNQVKAVSEKIWEAADYLNTLGLQDQPGPLNERYTYHVPCHRAWAPTIVDSPRHLLSAVSGSELVEMENPGKCCGAGGSFFMENRQLSERIRSHKLEDIAATGAGTVITQCPSCRFYLGVKLKDRKVMHPLFFLAKSYGLV
ncbi:MAG: hypothetical protein JL50_04730 [Peptococcaceae bacterium BICA1-7]|nr:MAG: hypothetical protein JL50_04730 [Peptococcaceae bacterium BICA1-7]HBV95928.1 (Fe-S)-binding protein [Desulfotomaculum sp.]